MPNILKALQGASGNADAALYVEDVFSTYLYTGNGSTQTITNGIDLDGEGGLVWIKNRDAADSHILTDVTRGAGEVLSTDTNTAGSTDADTTTAFNSDGFSIGADVKVNTNTEDYASWTFRKAPGFFDVVPFTGDGNNPHTVSHNLGSVPGFIVIRRTDSTGNWCVAAYDGTNYKTAFSLNSTAQAYVTTAVSNIATDTTVDAGWMGVNADGSANVSGGAYVMYLFAHDDQSFGENSDESIIKCGGYSGNGSATGPEISLGWEPQWVLIKNITWAGNEWMMFDVSRGMGYATNTQSSLQCESSGAEVTRNLFVLPNPDGFSIGTTDGKVNGSGADYIYIAIRRPMKTPESGTEVFKANYVDNGASFPDMLSGFPVDMYFRRYVNTTNNPYWFTRLLGTSVLDSTSTGAEQTFSANSTAMDSNVGVMNIFSTNNTDFYGWMFKRATGFFDVVAYSGNSTSGRNVAHNLGVAPEMMIVKRRTGISDWAVYSESEGATEFTRLNATTASGATSIWNSTAPTSSVFTLGTGNTVNNTGEDYIAYLFATLAGVSKVGSYTGTGSNVDVDCGFSAGARFILIKRTDSTGDWYVWDSVRGIVAGNDPYLLLNSTAAEVTTTDYIDPLSSGFTVTSSAPAALNASGGTYIYLAIA